MSAPEAFDWADVVTTPRRVGVTTALVTAVMKLGGTLVTRDSVEARRVARDLGCKTVSVHNPNALRGLREVLFFEPDAVQAMAAVMRTAWDAVHAKLAEVDRERVAARRELAEAKDALGPAWLVGGVSLAEGIKRKTEKLEALASGPAKPPRSDLKSIVDDARAKVGENADPLDIIGEAIRLAKERAR